MKPVINIKLVIIKNRYLRRWQSIEKSKSASGWLFISFLPCDMWAVHLGPCLGENWDNPPLKKENQIIRVIWDMPYDQWKVSVLLIIDKGEQLRSSSISMVVLGICQPVDLNVHVRLKDRIYLNKLRKIFDIKKRELCTIFVMTYKDTLWDLCF